MEEIARQVGARPKVHTEWPVTRDLYQAEEDFGSQGLFPEPVRDRPVTSTRESRTMILE